MTTEENLKGVKTAVAIIGEVIKAAGENPQVREAGRELGKTALIVTKTINNVFLPLAALNFAFDKARKYFDEQFLNDVAQRAIKIPAEVIIEPKASIAGPAIQGLAFCHEEEDLKEMYLNLLVSAMDGRVANSVHPAFVEIIKQLNANEAKLLQTVLTTDTARPIAEIYFTPDTDKIKVITTTLYRHLLDLRDDTLECPSEAPYLPAAVDNWIRLGLVKVNYQRELVNQDYSWVESRPEFILQRKKITVEGIVTFRKGSMRRTDFGKQFSHTVGLAAPELPTL